MFQFDDVHWNHVFLRANNLKFHAVVDGNGPVVLLLHGFPENWYSWRHQLLALSETGYRAVAVDMRGYNETERPRKVRDYATERLRADVLDLIRALGADRVHLVGHDWGGAVAWDFAAHYPQSLHSLTILNAPHPTVFLHHLRHSAAQRRRSWYMLFFQLPWLPETLINLDAKKQFDKTFRGWAHRKEMFPPAVIDAFREPMSQHGALTAGINYYRAAMRNWRALRDEVPSIRVPTQVIWGEDDKALGKELTASNAQYVDNSYEAHFIPDCSHWVQQEYPEQVNDLLLSFLKKVAKPRPAPSAYPTETQVHNAARP